MDINNFLEKMEVKDGDFIVLTGNFLKLSWLLYKSKLDLNFFIDKFIDKLGHSGTLVIKTFNWDFCRGLEFDIIKSKSKTGILGDIVLQRKDFVRTNHPIYSFAVYGKFKAELKALNNINSFDENSPFALFHKYNAKMITLDIDLQNSFTFVHYVEEINKVTYRYQKSFISDYIDENCIKKRVSYNMYVRDLKKNVQTSLNSLEEILCSKEIIKKLEFDKIEIRLIDLCKAYNEIENDILNNNARNLHTKD